MNVNSSFVTHQSSSAFRKLGILLGFTTVIRFVLAAAIDLGVDEAYYWTWSRHLDISYYDHPPFVAYLIRLSTTLFGENSFGVRFPAVVLRGVGIALAFRLGRRMFLSDEAGWLAALLWNLTPLFSLGVIMAPEALLGCFSIGALNLFWDIVSGRRPRWWLLGLVLGGALLSKYTGVLILLGIILYIIFGERKGRQILEDRHLWSAFGLSLILFLPVIIWNSRYNWASFRLIFEMGTRDSDVRLWELVMLTLLGQAAYIGPVLWGGCLIVLLRSWKYVTHNAASRFVLFFGGPPVILFLILGARSIILPHWPAIGYAVLLIGLAGWSVQNRTLRKVMVIGGILTGLLPTLILIVHTIYGVFQLGGKIEYGDGTRIVGDPASVHHGWEEWAHLVEAVRQPNGPAVGIAAVVTDKWEEGGKAAYTLRNQTLPVVVWAPGKRSQFDFWSKPEDFQGKDLLYVTTTVSGVDCADKFYRADSFVSLPVAVWPLRNAQVTSFHMEVLRGFRGLRSVTDQ